MEPTAVVRTLQELAAENSSDVVLLQALACRFNADAEEFFPPQIEALLAAFTELGFSSPALVEGLAGRLGDVCGDASPRRVLRLLRCAAALRFGSHEAWPGALIPQVHRHLPSLCHGLPSALASFHALRVRDPELMELLLVRGLIFASGDEVGTGGFPGGANGFFSRLFERWSRHELRYDEAEERARALAREAVASGPEGPSPFPDLRDALTLLTGLFRCERGNEEANDLELHLVERLRHAGTPAEAAVCLEWMRKLSLRSPPLWQSCADLVESGAGERLFARRYLPSALHALAALMVEGEDGREATLVAHLLATPGVAASLQTCSAAQALELLQAACFLRAACPSRSHEEVDGVVPWGLLAGQVARLSRSLSLRERRDLHMVSLVLPAVAQSAEGAGLASDLLRAPPLPSGAALPPLPVEAGVAMEPEMDVVEVGAEMLWCPKRETQEEGPKDGIRVLGFGDIFAASPGTVLDAPSTLRTTPVCRLAVQSLESQGWQVELRP